MHQYVIKADIVGRNRGYWDLYEVKSATSVKEHYWDDVAVQYYVLSGCGLPMHKAYLVHINNSYVRVGDIVPEELFVIQDITGIVKEKQAAIPETLVEMREMLRGKVPKIDIGPHCEAPYECDFMDHCWKHAGAIRLLPAGAWSRPVGAVPAGSRQTGRCPDRFAQPDAEDAGGVSPGQEIPRRPV